jgi:hypothetical protein
MLEARLSTDMLRAPQTRSLQNNGRPPSPWDGFISTARFRGRSDKTCEYRAGCVTGSYGEEEGERGKDLALQD